MAKHVQREARLTSWRKYVSGLNSTTPMSRIWSRVKKMTGKYQSHLTPYLLSNADVMADPADVAEALADHYASVSSRRNYSARFLRQKEQVEAVPLNFCSQQEHEYNSPLTFLELRCMLRNCGNTAARPDSIHYAMLKHSHPTCLQLLLAIYNRVWSEGVFPLQWKIATVLSFPKPEKPAELPSSYRPIALTSCVWKLLEKMVNVRLVRYLEVNKYLPSLQFGFRRMHSTTDSLIRFTSDILESFRNRNSVLCVFFDMEKAYDKTWRHGILRTLHSFELRGHLMYYVNNFLLDRTFCTKIGAALYTPHTQEEGVPQGSVLSCTLFSVAISGILNSVPCGARSSLYVDDFMMYVTGGYFPAMERRLQVAINAVSGWATEHGFTFSHAKTTCVHFSRKRGLHPEASLFMNGQRINCGSSARFLGLDFDSRLRWTTHMRALRIQCLKRLDLKCLPHHMGC